MKNKGQIQWVFAVLLVLLAACSPSKPAAVSPASSSPTEALSIPAATLSTEVPTELPAPASTDMPSEPAASFPTGRFVSAKDKAVAFQYNEDGTFGVFLGKVQVLDGIYSVEGNLITSENPTETDPQCQGDATYQWSFDGSNLTFAPTGEDTCKARREANADTYILDANYIAEIKVDAADFSYTAPETVSAGWVRVTLTNSGQEPHHVQFLRLNDGVTAQQFEEALKQGEGPALAMTQQMGGVGAVAPGGSAQAVINLTAGDYVILCLIPSPGDQLPHHAKGMVKTLTVLPYSSSSSNEPAADLTVRLKDYTFDLPESLATGPMTIKVVNDGPEPHEFNLLRLADGMTLVDVVQFLTAPSGPPPFTPVGGMNGLGVGISGYVEFDFQPGTYVAICNIPSPKAEGHPHFTLGMIKQFTVAP